MIQENKLLTEVKKLITKKAKKLLIQRRGRKTYGSLQEYIYPVCLKNLQKHVPWLEANTRAVIKNRKEKNLCY